MINYGMVTFDAGNSIHNVLDFNLSSEVSHVKSKKDTNDVKVRLIRDNST